MYFRMEEAWGVCTGLEVGLLPGDCLVARVTMTPLNLNRNSRQYYDC